MVAVVSATVSTNSTEPNASTTLVRLANLGLVIRFILSSLKWFARLDEKLQNSSRSCQHAVSGKLHFRCDSN
jgi:hypothetical protein